MTPTDEGQASLKIKRKYPTKQCSVKNCQSHINETGKVSLFRPTPKTEPVWTKIVGKEMLNPSFKVCSIHFEEKEIKKSLTLSTGQVVPLQKWYLLPGAIPTKHIDLPKVSKKKKTEPKGNSKQNAKKSKGKPIKKQIKLCNSIFITPDNAPLTKAQELSGLESSDVISHQDHDYAVPTSIEESLNSTALITSDLNTETAQDNTQNDTNGDCQIVGQHTSNNENPLSYVSNALDDVTGSNEKPLPSPLTDDMIKEIQEKVLLPSKDWHWLLNSEKKTLTCVNHTLFDDNQLLVKSVIISGLSEISYFVNGKPIVQLNFRNEFSTLRELWLSIRRFSMYVPCVGIKDKTFDEVELAVQSKGLREADGRLRSKQCTILVINEDASCFKCKTYHEILKKSWESLLTKSQESSLKLFENMKQKVKYLKEKNEELNVSIKKLEEDLKNHKEEAEGRSLEHFIKQLQPLEQSMLRLYQARLKALKKGDPNSLKGLRFDDSVKNHCGLLWLKSPSTYKFMRRHGIVPLPSPLFISTFVKKNAGKSWNAQQVRKEVNETEPGPVPELTGTCHDTDFDAIINGQSDEDDSTGVAV